MNAFISNIIIILVLALALSSASIYIYKEKKKGSHCIGCPMAGKCPRKNMCSGNRSSNII